jgi:hypothetical protein
VYEIIHPNEAQDAHPTVPQNTDARAPLAYEVEYMRHKGVFDTFPDNVQDEILFCYLEHVHPFMPVVDLGAFLDTHIRHQTSPLLLWSMNLAAANVSPLSIGHCASLIFDSSQVHSSYSRLATRLVVS